MASRRRDTSNPKPDDDDTPPRRPPAKTLEGRENQMVALAMDVVEKRLLDGSATSQEVTHFLKLGSTQAQLEKDQLRARNALLEKQVEQLESNKRMEELYSDAIAAMRSYSGQAPARDDYYED